MTSPRAPGSGFGSRSSWALVFVVVYAAMIFGGSSEAVPASIQRLPIPDYVEHGTEYAVLGFLLSRWLLLTTGRRTFLFLALLPCLIAGLYGATDELHQYFVPGRDSQLHDVLADTVGGFLGALAYGGLSAYLLRRKQAARPTDAGAATREF